MNIPPTLQELTDQIAEDSIKKALKLLPGRQFAFTLETEPGYNAFAYEDANAVLHFAMTANLRNRLFDICVQFKTEVLDELAPRRPLGWRAGLLAAIDQPGAGAFDNIELFRMAMTLIMGHEIGHLRQNHRLSKAAMGLPGNPRKWSERDLQEELPHSRTSFIFELAADHEAIEFCIPLFFQHPGPESADTKHFIAVKKLWIFMCAATLVFFLLEREGRARTPFGFLGTHPSPPSRLLWMVRQTSMIMARYSNGPNRTFDERVFDYLIDAIDFTTHFWHGILHLHGAALTVPEIHPTLELQRLPAYAEWQAAMVSEWNTVIPVINENISIGPKLPTFGRDAPESTARVDERI